MGIDPPSTVTTPRVRTWPMHLAAIALFAALACSLFPTWLLPYRLPQRGGPDEPFRAGDLTPLFYVWNTILYRTIRQQHEMPLWTDHIYCGEPFLPKAQIGVFSLTTALLLLLPPELVSTWTFLLHLALAGAATYAAALWLLDPTGLPLTARWIAALAAGAFYETSAILVEHTVQGHGPIVVAACFTPLVLASAIKAFSRHGAIVGPVLLSGGLVAIQFLAGGATATLYSGVGVATLLATAALCPPRVPRHRRVRAVVACGAMAAVALAGAAVKLLPALALMPVSNRAGGLEPWTAAAPIIEFPPPLVAWPLDPTAAATAGCWLLLPLALAAIGVTNPALSRQGRIGLLFVAVVGLVVAVRPEAFVALWYTFPGFRYQRIPQRALMLFYAAVALLLAGGISHLLRWLGLAQRLGRARLLAAFLAVAAVMAAIGENLAWRSPPSPVRDIRTEQRANALWQSVARSESRHRVHVLESRDRNWGIEHITAPLGLETMVGWDHMWLLDYLGAEGRYGRDIPPFVEASYRARHPERFWALASVRWVSSSRPEPIVTGPDWHGRLLRRLVPLELRGTFPESPYAQPHWSDGPYLFENPLAQPRAWFAHRAIVVLGSRRAARRLAVYRLIDELPFDPEAWVFVELGASELALLGELPNVLAVVNVGATALADAIAWDPYREPVPRALRKRLERVVRHPVRAIPVRYRRKANHTRELAVANCPPGYVVLAEKFAHFPGWTAHASGHTRQVPLLSANGVFTALPIHGSSPLDVTLRYRPPGFALGAVLSSLTWLALAGYTLRAAFRSPGLGTAGGRADSESVASSSPPSPPT